MTRPSREQELRVGGLRIAARFTLSMFVALILVMVGAGFLLVSTSTSVSQNAQERRIADSVALTTTELRGGNYEQAHGQRTIETSNPRVWRFDVDFGLESGARKPGYVYEYRGAAPDGGVAARLLVSTEKDETGRGLVGLIAGVTIVVILVGTAVALVFATQVSKPIEAIVDDIRQIARGDLHHRSRVKGGGEIGLLTRAINRMAAELEEAQEAEIELSVREREMAVADEVREALHPETVPTVGGYDIGARHVGAPQPGGDFLDFIERGDGRQGFLVCGVSGEGIPGALVGATARAYLRSELTHAAATDEALKRANRYLARDVRRGMYATALYVLLDPETGEAEIACAGHKVPLLRVAGADGKLRTIQPEGIALGFDPGPVFDRTLKLRKISLEEGDRLVLSNTGPVTVTDPDGRELGEKAFYRRVVKYGALDSESFCEALENAFYEFADETPFPNDISIITLARTA